MRELYLVAICLIFISPALCAPKLSTEDSALLNRIIAYDKDAGGGKNYESRDSGVLAWDEASALEMFCSMYHVTGDAHWLDRLVSHADVIVGHATRDSRGRTGWFTAHYSNALADASADKANTGSAELTPAKQTLSDANRVEKVLGHTYSVTTQDDGSLQIRDETAGTTVGTVSKGQSEIPVSEFTFKLSGSPVPGDKFVVGTTAPEPTDYVVHDGMIIRPIADFVEIVLSDPSLKPKYGATAKRYLAFIEKSMIPKWDERWRDFADGGGAYLSTNLRTHRFPNIVLPHNQYLAFGRVLFPLYRVTRNKAYLGRATKMARFFKSKLTLVDGGYIWNYWDAARPEDEPGKAMVHCEDTSHGAIDVAFVVDAYEMGVVFTRQDIDRIATTYAKHIWNQSLDKPLYCRTVDRRLDPKGDNDTTALYGWQLLARYSPEVVKAVEPAYKNGYSWGPVAAEWLRARYDMKGTQH